MPWPEPRPEPRAVSRGIGHELKKQVLDPSPRSKGKALGSIEPWPEPRPEPWAHAPELG